MPTSSEGDTMHNAQATQFCSIHDDPPWTIRDPRMPYQNTAMPDGDAFVFSLAQMAASAISEKAPASWKKEVIFYRQTRPAGLVLQVWGRPGVPTGPYRSSGLYGAPTKKNPESAITDRP